MYKRQGQTLKGWLFVFVTTVLLYLLIRQEENRQQQIEQALRQSEARYRRLADNAPDLVYRVRLVPDRAFEYVSPSALTITGYTPEEHYADPDLGWKMVHPDDQDRLQEVAGGSGQPDQPITLRWMRKDGSIVWTEQRNVPIYDDEGTMIAVEGIARDISARVEACLLYTSDAADE